VTQTVTGVELERHDSETSGRLIDELADLYRAVSPQQEPQASNPFYSRERFLDRLANYGRAPGFELVTARDATGRLVGMLYGYVLPPGARWWSVMQPAPSEEFAAETGSRTFAIKDMVVATDWQRRGIARAMHDTVRAAHPDMRFTLTVRPDNKSAQAAYRSWGYRLVGTQQPYPDSPVFETMLLDPS